MGQPNDKMDKDWRKGGSESPAEKAKLQESIDRVEEVHREKIEERRKAAEVKPVEPATPYYKESK